MREEHARYKASEEEQRVSEAQRATDSLHETTTYQPSSDVVGGLLSQLSLTNVISLVGIGLTIYTVFFRKTEKNEWKAPPVIQMSPPKPPKQQPVARPKKKFGMQV